MAKEELIEFEGSVLELLPDARFRVKLDNGHETLAYSSGRMKKNRTPMPINPTVHLFNPAPTKAIGVVISAGIIIHQ